MSQSIIRKIYDILLSYYGPQRWWPAETFIEMMVGAVLTQNTNWANVEKALDNLRAADMLDFAQLASIPEQQLAELLRPAGYYNVKARRLKNLVAMLMEEYGGDIVAFQEDACASSRANLLTVRGIGEETADSILLYGCQKPVFVVDTYTHRVFSRHSLVPDEASYEDMQDVFYRNLDSDVELFNEYHALIVQLAKEFCKKTRPQCSACPLAGVNR